jgi:hypothetical protein
MAEKGGDWAGLGVRAWLTTLPWTTCSRIDLAPFTASQSFHCFLKFSLFVLEGGIGGTGGASGASVDNGKNGESQNSNGREGAPPPDVTKQDRGIGGNVPSEFRNRDCKIFFRGPRRRWWLWFSAGWRRWYR